MLFDKALQSTTFAGDLTLSLSCNRSHGTKPPYHTLQQYPSPASWTGAVANDKGWTRDTKTPLEALVGV